MNRWQEMALAFAGALARIGAHHDPAARALAVAEARRLLQQFMAAGNVAIEGLEKPANERTVRHPYRDD